MIVWRLFARNRQLMVRTLERAFSMKRDLVAYFVADPVIRQGLWERERLLLLLPINYGKLSKLMITYVI